MSRPLLVSRRFRTGPVADRRVCICFNAEIKLAPGHMKSALDAHLDEHGVPEVMVFVGFDYNADAVEQFIQSAEYREILPRHSAGADQTYQELHLSFGPSGGLRECRGHWNSGQIAKVEHELKRSVATVIFRRRGALLEAPSGFHFVKPSERHSRQFIRAGEALCSSQETFFLAAWLLSRVPITTERIYCDSASIASLGYALIELHWRFQPQQAMAVAVESFGGYRGARDFSFLDGPGTCYLISSSTSGGLNRRLTSERQIDAPRIHLFSYIGAQPPLQTVFDLTQHEKHNAEGFVPVESYAEERCPHCAENNRLIYILGDQFLPAAPRIEMHAIRKDSVPEWLNGFLEEFRGLGVPRVHHLDTGTNRTIEVFVELDRFFKQVMKKRGKFAQALAQRVHQNLPGRVSCFVVLSDPASRAFFKTILRTARRDDLRQVPVIDKVQLMRRPEEEGAKIGPGCVVVVCSVAGSGRNLLAVSQTLRNLAKGDAIYYLVGLSRTSSAHALQELRTDLTFGQWGRGSYRLDTIRDIYLPGYAYDQNSAWTRELNHWKSMFGSPTRRLRGIEARMQFLDALRSSKYDPEPNLFLPSTVDCKPLALRPNFSLVSENLSRVPFTQSEVYFIVTAVLHHARNKRSQAANDQNSDFVHHIWTPRIFERFNDGVIQAALLRAAHPSELDYSGSSEASGMMKDTLVNVFEHCSTQIGEAGQEFMLALASRKLRIESHDLIQVKRAVGKCRFQDELARHLADSVLALRDGEQATTPAGGTAS